jgi:transcriptional regulator with XRE-family HTH domain
MNQRQILSERFISLFNKFSENEPLSYREVAGALDISINTLNHYLEGTHLITILDAYLFCNSFNGDYNYMFQGITNWQEEVADKLKCGFQSDLPAVGGYGISSDYDSFKPYINRNINYEKKVFEVIGDSMTGGRNNLEEHDKLETKRVYDINDIKNNFPYVIESDEGICVKELKALKRDNKIIGITCTSDLDLYKPYDIIGNKRTKIYKIINVFKESKRNQLKEVIKHDKIEQIINCLHSAFPYNENLISLSARIVALNNQTHAGCYDLDTSERKRNILRKDTLNFILQISNNDLNKINTIIL